MTYVLSFSGDLLRRGFWLYVWEIAAPNQELLYYVGRTGDSSSTNAQSPFNRMGQHLGFNEKNNVLRRRLKVKGIDPEDCEFRLLAHGPILQESATHDEHRELLDITAGLEKGLACAMTDAGYTVINTVNCHKPLDQRRFAELRAAFATHFPKLAVRKKHS